MDHDTDTTAGPQDGASWVLLVEDDRGQRVLLEQAFARSGDAVTITAVSTMQAAREYLASRSPDLLIVDLDLPDGNGRDLLPGNPEQSPYPIIVLTGHGDEQTAASMIKAGASDYVRKSQAALQAMPRIAKRVLHNWQLVRQRRDAEQTLRQSASVWQESSRPCP